MKKARNRPLQPLRTSYGIGAGLARALPGPLRYGVASVGGRAWHAASRGQARAALTNYAAVLGRPRTDPEVARVTRRAFQNYGQMLVDFLLLSRLSRQEVLDRVSVEGLEHIEAALGRGRGCIMVLPHMGSWDLAGSMVGIFGYRALTVAERFPGSLNQAVIDTRQRFGLEVVPLGRSAVPRILAALDENALVGLLCDLRQGPGVEVSFFGQRAVVPRGPAAFALKKGCAIIPVCIVRVAPGRYRARVEAALPTPSSARGKEHGALMQSIITRFEIFIREHPDQWYAFRPMFEEVVDKGWRENW